MSAAAFPHRGAAAPQSAFQRPDPGLLARCGGAPAIEAAIDGLYDGIAADPVLSRIFRVPRRAPAKRFFVEWLGGPRAYSEEHWQPRGMARVHYPVVVTRQGAGLWLGHFRRGLGRAGVPPEAAAEVMARLTPMAMAMVNEELDLATAPLHGHCEQLSDRGIGFVAACERAAKGDAAAVRAAIATDPSAVRRRGTDGRTLLWLAAKHGREEVVTLLADAGADLDAPGCVPLQANFPFTPTDPGESYVPITPHCAAAWKGKRAIAGLLTGRGAVVDVFTAAFLGDLERLRAMLAERPDLARAEDPADDVLRVTALHHAVAGAQLETARELIASGAEVVPHQTWLLSFAARRNHPELVRLLLTHGADARRSRFLGSFTAANHRVADLLIAGGLDVNACAFWGPLVVKTCRGDAGADPLPRVRMLIERGARVDARGGAGNTPLHFAASSGNLPLAEVLLAHGAGIDARNDVGETALFLAVRKRQVAMIDFLRARGADLAVRNADGKSAREVAAASKPLRALVDRLG
jgi:ankyrin repeat protein/truncated hemoglobin YjbI